MREAFALIEADFYIMIDADTEHDASILPQALAYFSTHKLDMLNIARSASIAHIARGIALAISCFQKAHKCFLAQKLTIC